MEQIDFALESNKKNDDVKPDDNHEQFDSNQKEGSIENEKSTIVHDRLCNEVRDKMIEETIRKKRSIHVRNTIEKFVCREGVTARGGLSPPKED